MEINGNSENIMVSKALIDQSHPNFGGYLALAKDLSKFSRHIGALLSV